MDEPTKLAHSFGMKEVKIWLNLRKLNPWSGKNGIMNGPWKVGQLLHICRTTFGWIWMKLKYGWTRWGLKNWHNSPMEMKQWLNQGKLHLGKGGEWVGQEKTKINPILV